MFFQRHFHFPAKFWSYISSRQMPNIREYLKGKKGEELYTVHRGGKEGVREGIGDRELEKKGEGERGGERGREGEIQRKPIAFLL
jgi:hypothetical protein